MKNFLARLFLSAKNQAIPNIKFGRYSDSYKEEEKYDAWDRSLEMYEQGKYLKCFEFFLIYLTDENLGNLTYTNDGQALEFSIYQGSKKITGYATNKKLYAEAKIAQVSEYSIGFLRRLIEANYHLQYTRFALDDNNCISMVFDTYVLDASPYKLYYALKELATNADKQDDILISEFPELSQVNTVHIREISAAEKKIKHAYLKSSINEALETMENGSLNLTHYPGAASYLMLDCVYRLDFLLKPEGMVMEEIEQIQDIFFKTHTKNAQEKNIAMRKRLKEVGTISFDTFQRELYEVVSTFGITLPSGHERLRSLIQSELPNMKWYYDRGHDDYAIAIPGYIVGYCLYNFALPLPDKELLLLYYQIIHQDYFNQLGFNFQYQKEGKIQKKEVITELKRKRAKFLYDYPKLNMNIKVLNFYNKAMFCKTYLELMNNMNVTRIKKKK